MKREDVGKAVAPEGKGSVVLLGPDNPGFWTVFSASVEASDAAPHPLDRWSERVITGLAHDLGGHPVFPFGGPPYAPFLRWAAESGEVWPSPIGPFVGAETGLWVSFRGGIVLETSLSQHQGKRPCDTCSAPCASACPVEAFSRGQYDVQTCRAHLRSPEGQDCLARGCKARAACPVGPSFAPVPDLAMLHMTAFRDA
jgi:hypothetical protein